MPIFAGIGFALGVGTAATATAAATGVAAATLVGATVVAGAAAAIGTSIYKTSAETTAMKKSMAAMSGSNLALTDVGRLVQDEAQDTAAIRLARAGKYFTSPLGDQSALSVGAQKVFS